MQEAKNMVRLIGAVEYDDDGFNVSSPKKVILSDFTPLGTWTFIIQKNGVRSVLDLIFQKFTDMSYGFETDHVANYCVVVTDNEKDLEFFMTKCGIPAVRILNKEYSSFIPSEQYDFLWNSEHYEKAYEKVNKIGSFLIGKCIKNLKCDLVFKNGPTLCNTLTVPESVKNIRLIGAVQYDYDGRLNYSEPTKVILSDLTVDGTWTFSVNNDDVQSMVNKIYDKYLTMIKKFKTDNYCLILTETKRDCEFFMIKCGIPAVKIRNKNYRKFVPCQRYPEDYHYILWNKDGFEEAYEKIKKIGSFCDGRCMKRKVCGLKV